jgi:hypothetical protein
LRENAENQQGSERSLNSIESQKDNVEEKMANCNFNPGSLAGRDSTFPGKGKQEGTSYSIMAADQQF